MIRVMDNKQSTAREESEQPLAYWFSILLLSITLPLSGWLLGVADPFFLHAAFPWILVPSVLVALRYGTSSGLGSWLLLAVLSRTYLWAHTLPIEQGWLELWIGILLLTIVTGELSNQWRKAYATQQQALTQAQQAKDYAEQQLQLLQISHTQLEVEAMGSHQSLWRSLKLLEDELATDPPQQERLLILAQKMMQTLATYDWLEVAGFYAVTDKGTVLQHPIAQVGKMLAISECDRLVHEVLTTARPISLDRDSSLAESYTNLGTSLIAVFPIIDKSGKVRLLLAVQQIHFLAFENSNLNLLATLCTWLGLRLDEAQTPPITPNDLSTQSLNQWRKTEREVHSALKLVACHHKSTLLVGLNVENSPNKTQYIEYFANNMRGGNHCWQLEHASDTVIILLLPMLDGESFGLLQRRLEDDFCTHFHQTFVQAGVIFYSQYFYRYQHRQELVGYLDLLKQPRYALTTA